MASISLATRRSGYRRRQARRECEAPLGDDGCCCRPVVSRPRTVPGVVPARGDAEQPGHLGVGERASLSSNAYRAGLREEPGRGFCQYLAWRSAVFTAQAASSRSSLVKPSCSERIPRRWAAPVGNGVRDVAFDVPVRKRVKHVWAYWGVISGQLRPALAAQHRLGKSSPEPVEGRPNPIRAFVRAAARGDSLGGDPFGVPGCDSRAEPSCTVGAAARMSLSNPKTAFSGVVDDRCVTKINHYYNGIGVHELVQEGAIDGQHGKHVRSRGNGGCRDGG